MKSEGEHSDYVCLAESGWELIEKIELLLAENLDMDTVADALGFPKSDLYQLLAIGQKNRDDLLEGIMVGLGDLDE